MGQTVQFSFNFTPCFSILFASSSRCVEFERHKKPSTTTTCTYWGVCLKWHYLRFFRFFFPVSLWLLAFVHMKVPFCLHIQLAMATWFSILFFYSSHFDCSNDTDGDLRFFLRRLLRSFPFCFRRCDAMQSEIKWRKSTEERRRRSRGKNQFIYIVSAVELIAVYMCWSRGYVRCNFRRISEKGFIEFGDKFPLEIWAVPASIHTNQWYWIESG